MMMTFSLASSTVCLCFLINTAGAQSLAPPCNEDTFGSDSFESASGFCLYIDSTMGNAADRAAAKAACAASPVYPSELATAETDAKWNALYSLLEGNSGLWFHVNMQQFSTNDRDEWYWFLDNDATNVTVPTSFFTKPDLYENSHQASYYEGYFKWHEALGMLFDDDQDYTCRVICQYRMVCYRNDLDIIGVEGANASSASFDSEVVVNATIVGGNVTYECDSDKATIDGQVMQTDVCNTTLQWSNTGKPCSKVCPPMAPIGDIISIRYSNAPITAPNKPLVHNHYVADTLATFNCAPGHFPTSKNVLCSGVNGTWLGIQPAVCYMEHPKRFNWKASGKKGAPQIACETMVKSEDRLCGERCVGWQCKGFSYEQSSHTCLLHNDTYDGGNNSVVAGGYQFWDKVFPKMEDFYKI